MRKFSKKPLIFITILLTLFSLSTATDILTPTHPLSDGQTLISSGGNFALGFFTPLINSNNLYVGIWYNKIPVHTVVWVANRHQPVTAAPTTTLSIATDGSLLITDRNTTVIIWSSASTSTLSNPVAQLLDSGNFVIRDANNNNPDTFAWQSFDHPTDTLIPGMELGWNLTTGLNRNLTAWSSPIDPSPGNYSLAVDLRGDPQLAFWAGSVRQWRSGPWTGVGFSGEPETPTYTDMFIFNFVNNKEGVYYTVDVVNKSTITRLVVNQSGSTQRFVWLDESDTWGLYWYTPKAQCDGYGLCGAYGVCDPNGSPMCSCLPGFEPKSPANWALRDASDGCVRRTRLSDCRNGTDGFVTVHRTLLPDTVYATTVDMMMSLDECRAVCLRNCSCLGFASADVRGGGRGCIIWSHLLDIDVSADGGQDLYVRLAAADIGSISGQSRKSGWVALTVVLSTVLGALLLACVVGYTWRKRKRRRGTSPFNDENNEDDTGANDIELPLFDLGTVAAATNNFSDENKLGEGGFGPVYKGKMADGQEIAVKRLSRTSLQGLDELKTEVMLIAKLQHRNLVRILGCCIQGEERMLLYEYMTNKSLDTHLFDEDKVVLLDWQTRYRIILGIARGLLYLHEDSRFRIIHRDLKASNILLDREMKPKISDFGMARIFGGDETKSRTRRVVGTYGYMSPEYALDGIFSVKSDVFSFGVLILEIISGERNKGVYLSEPHQYLLGHAWSLWNEGNGLQLVDASMDCIFSAAEVLRCIKVGLLCVQERPEDRPTMSSVILMLGSDHESLPQPKQPGFLVRENSLKVNSSSNKQCSHSINDVTLTMSIGR